MNRIFLCLLPLLLLTAGCFSSIDDEDYKAFTADKWREQIKDNENRLKPEEQRPIKGLDNPIRLFIGAIAEGISWVHDLATGHNFLSEAKKLYDVRPDYRRTGVIYLSDHTAGRHDPYALRYIELAQKDPEPTVQSMAIRALNRARDKRGIGIFLKALDDQ